jgi:hypothetical protein
MPSPSGKQIVRVVYVSVQVLMSNDSPVTTSTHVTFPESEADIETLALLPPDEADTLTDDADD